MNEPPRQLPSLVEGDQLHQRHPDAVGEAAVDLALDDHRVDARAAVVDRDEAPHRDLAGARIDVDDADVGAERERQVRRVVDRSRRRARPRRPRAARSSRARPSAISWIVSPFSGSPLTNQRPFSHSRSSGETSSIAAATSRALSRTLRATSAVAAPRHRRRAAAVGAEPERRAVGVAVDHLDVLRRDAELLGDDLGERRLVALALGLAADRRAAALPVGWTRSSAPSFIPRPRMSMCLRGPAPTASVKNETPMPISSPRSRFSACSRAQLVVAGDLHRLAQRRLVVAGVVHPAGLALVRELLGARAGSSAAAPPGPSRARAASASTMRSTR